MSKVHLIRIPTFLVNGEYDFEADDVCAPFFRDIDKIKWVKFAESSHIPHWEERERYMQVVESFLREIFDPLHELHAECL
jgi:pimeloyl-ACP methyl ester carboxylesterase